MKKQVNKIPDELQLQIVQEYLSTSLTQKELNTVNKGVVPERLKKTWGISLAEAKELVKEGNIEVLENDKASS